jgi:hypothetical protein
LDHTGRTNPYEIASSSKLAVRYNDESVLENHHVSTMFKILLKEKYNILENMTNEQYNTVRKFSIANILGTDMKKHFDILKQIEFKVKRRDENGEQLIQKEDDKKLLSAAIVHTCDLSQVTKPFEIAKTWSLRIC